MEIARFYEKGYTAHTGILQFLYHEGDGHRILMDYISCDISTIVGGQAASFAAVLLSAGTPGKRLAFQNAQIMVHKISASFFGKEPDIEIQAENIRQLNDNLVSILAKNCSKSVREMERAMDRDNFMTAEEAKSFGLIDGIITTNKRY